MNQQLGNSTKGGDDHTESGPLGWSTPSYLGTEAIVIKNTPGSTAGAGSGDFHQYRYLRRKEMFRVRKMEAELKKEKEDKEFEDMRLGKVSKAEAKTSKKAAKRKRQKELKRNAKKSKSNVKKSNEEEDDSDEDKEETTPKDEKELEQEDLSLEGPPKPSKLDEEEESSTKK